MRVPRWSTTNPAIIAASTVLVDKIKALVLVEPAAIGDADSAPILRSVPLLAIYGGYIDSDARWPTIRQKQSSFFANVTAAGGKVYIFDLPKMGVKGNSHMIMMDKNNAVVADLILKRFAELGFWK